MSAMIVLDNITIKNNPSLFTQQIQLEVTFTTLDVLTSPISWKVIYIGSAVNEDYDQILQQFQIDPIPNCCTSKFQLSCSPPNAQNIPSKQLLCVTALILTASYRHQQFIRVGYYVHNQLVQGFQVQQNQQIPINIVVSNIKRTIISDKPRITKFNIEWKEPQQKVPKQQQPIQTSLLQYFQKMNKSLQERMIQSDNLCKTSEKQSTQQGDSLSMMKCQ